MGSESEKAFWLLAAMTECYVEPLSGGDANLQLELKDGEHSSFDLLTRALKRSFCINAGLHLPGGFHVTRGMLGRSQKATPLDFSLFAFPLIPS